jgi:hypothetical protein
MLSEIRVTGARLDSVELCRVVAAPVVSLMFLWRLLTAGKLLHPATLMPWALSNRTCSRASMS